jgi:flagellar hook-associated protein 2
MASGSTLGVNNITLTSATSPATTTTITTASGETYSQLATAINAVTPSLGVTATAGTDSSGNSTLSVVSQDGTTPFTINQPSSTGASLGFTQALQGADASLTVDGVPIQSASNTVSGSISGVTLNLLGAAPGTPISLTVASDASQVSTAINQFVTDYNTAIGLVNSQFNVDSTTNSQGVLGTDATVVSLQSALEQAFNYVYTPATGTTSVSTIGDLGITMANDGTLSVDSATLNSALTNNATDVQNFFEGTALNGFANSVYNALNTYTSPANGAFKVDLSSMAATNADLTSQINDYESGYIASQQTVLTADFSQAEVALQQLPQQMAQINALLGLTSTGNSNG